MLAVLPENLRIHATKSILCFVVSGVIGFHPLLISAQFIPVGNQLGVVQVNTGSVIFGTGVSVHDFDGDGLDDLSFGTIDDPPRFYRNTGNGFEDYDFPHPSPPLPVKSILWVDIDNDGDKDLLLTYENGPIRLYENTGDMVLIDITASSGITIENGLRYTGASFGDFNNDGFLDFYVCKFYNSSVFSGVQYENKLYRNNGDNTFTDVTYEANASVGVNASFMASWFDYDQDGWQDLFIVNDRIFNQNYLLRNNGDGTFTDVSEETGINYFIDAMGFSPGDYNNDLLIDFFVANSQFMGNHLYQHQPDHTFVNVAPEAGVEAFELCWSGLWMDHNNNGWQDLHVGVEFTVFGQMAPNLFFVNNGDGTFTESAESLWLAGDHYSTFATAQGDWNNDGYPDFVTANRAPHPCMLWQNTGGSNNYLAVTLEGTLSNRDAIGAHIFCYSSGTAQMRYTLCGENYLGQNSQRKVFGIGQSTQIDSLVVKWLSGHVDTFYDLTPNQTYHFIEGQSITASIEASAESLCQAQAVELFAPFGEQILWSTGASGVTSISVTQPGEYWYTAETQQGISFTSDTLVISENGLPEFDFSIYGSSCANGEDGSIEISGAIPDTDLWVEVNGLPAGWIVENLVSGAYTIEIGNASGCSVHYTAFLPNPQNFSALAIPGDIACNGGSTSVDWVFFGGQGAVNIHWGELNPDSLQAGIYELIVTDSLQCSTLSEFVINEPELLEVEITQLESSLSAEVTGGTPPYSYAWYAGETFLSAAGTLPIDVAQVYHFEVVDANGCSVQTEFEIELTIANTDARTQAMLYPNPAHEFIYYSGSCLSDRFSIIGADGRTVRSMPCYAAASPLIISISDLAPGVYSVVFEHHPDHSLRFIKH